MKKVLIASVVAGALTSGFAAGLSAKHGCIACHGPNMERKAPPVTPETKVVANLTKEEIKTALKGYKAGTYGRATKGIMQGQAARLSEDDINAIAQEYGK